MVRENDDQSDEARIETYLQGLNVAALRKLVLEASWCDGALREKLLMAAAVAESTGVSALRKVVKQATRTNGFVEYREAGGYANRLEDLAELLSQRIEDGQPELIEVIEEAIGLAEEVAAHRRLRRRGDAGDTGPPQRAVLQVAGSCRPHRP